MVILSYHKNLGQWCSWSARRLRVFMLGCAEHSAISGLLGFVFLLAFDLEFWMGFGVVITRWAALSFCCFVFTLCTHDI